MIKLRHTAGHVARRVLPAQVYEWIHARARGGEYRPPAQQVRFGHLRRLTPIGRRWGRDRGGQPIDRYYIERFLAAHADDIRGRVLEVQDARYTRRFGGDRVIYSDVLHVAPGNPAATIVADLESAPQIPANMFDCIILTQVLPFVKDVSGAVATIYRILRPGGVMLATVPGISQIVRYDMERWGDYWRFTTLSVHRLLATAFPTDLITIEAHGNVLTAVAFLHGLAAQELRQKELEYQDPDYQLLITARARKPPAEKDL